MSGELKRYFIKYVRDGAKSKYPKGTECRICGVTEDLDFHHFSTLSVLANKWVKDRGLNIKTADDAMKWRDVFIEEHPYELYDDAVTLCKTHHEKLHSIYGGNPRLVTAKKQARWVERQREKNGLE